MSRQALTGSTKILGTITVLDALGGGLGIWITGVLFDRTRSYESAFMLIAGLVFLALLAALALQDLKPSPNTPRRRRHRHSEA